MEQQKLPASPAIELNNNDGFIDPAKSEFIEGSAASNTSGKSGGFADFFSEATQNTKNDSFSQATGQTEGASGPGNSTPPGGGPSQPSGKTVGDLVSGKFVIELIDAIVPGFAVGIARKIGYDAKPSDLKMTKGEKELASQPMGECLKTIPLNLNNPWVMLGLTIGGIYASKIVENSENFKKRKKPVAIHKDLGEVQSVYSQGEKADPIEEAKKEVESIMEQEKKNSLGANSDNIDPETAKIENLIKATGKMKKLSRANAIKWLKIRNKIPQSWE